MDTVTRLKQLRTRAKETQTKVAQATATTEHAERELAEARGELEAIPDLSLDLKKKLTPQIDRLITAAEEELTEAESSTTEIDAAIQGDDAE